jgi:hypothetical protein
MAVVERGGEGMTVMATRKMSREKSVKRGSFAGNDP